MPAQVLAGHLGRRLAELFLHMAFVDLGGITDNRSVVNVSRGKLWAAQKYDANFLSFATNRLC